MSYDVTVLFHSSNNGCGVQVTHGTLAETEKGFTLNYVIDGDGCAIGYDGEKLTQSRVGKMKLNGTFIESKETVMTISEAGGFGEIPVFTKSLTVFNTPVGKRIKIAYNLGGEDIRLEISAVRK